MSTFLICFLSHTISILFNVLWEVYITHLRLKTSSSLSLYTSHVLLPYLSLVLSLSTLWSLVSLSTSHSLLSLSPLCLLVTLSTLHSLLWLLVSTYFTLFSRIYSQLSYLYLSFSHCCLDLLFFTLYSYYLTTFIYFVLLSFAYRCAILVHWMTQFVIFGIASEEETLLAHVEVETLEAAITESNYRILLANVTLCLLSPFYRLRHGHFNIWMENSYLCTWVVVTIATNEGVGHATKRRVRYREIQILDLVTACGKAMDEYVRGYIIEAGVM